MPKVTPQHPLTIHRMNLVKDALAHVRLAYPKNGSPAPSLEKYVTTALNFAALAAFPNPHNGTGTPFDPPGIRDLPPEARELVHAVDRWLAANPPASGGVYEDADTRAVGDAWSRVWNRDVDIPSRLIDAAIAEYCTQEFDEWTKLVGSVVEIELGEDKNGSPIKETGQLLVLSEDGECVLLNEDGFRRHCWPVMKVRLPTHTTAQTSPPPSNPRTENTSAAVPDPAKTTRASSATQHATAPQKPDAGKAEEPQ